MRIDSILVNQHDCVHSQSELVLCGPVYKRQQVAKRLQFSMKLTRLSKHVVKATYASSVTTSTAQYPNQRISYPQTCTSSRIICDLSEQLP
jgi:hypothetical protein